MIVHLKEDLDHLQNEPESSLTKWTWHYTNDMKLIVYLQYESDIPLTKWTWQSIYKINRGVHLWTW